MGNLCGGSDSTKPGRANNNNNNASPAANKKKEKEEDEDKNLSLLNAMLDNFGATNLDSGNKEGQKSRLAALRLQLDDPDAWGCDLCRTPYRLWPDKSRALLGKGGFSEAYVVHDTRSEHKVGGHGELRAVKVIQKDTLTHSRRTIKHMASELAVALFVSPSSKRLNKAHHVYHSSTTIFIILELIRGEPADALTRIAHIVAGYAPNRIPEVPDLYERLVREAAEERIVSADAIEAGSAEAIAALSGWAESSGFLHRLALNVGASRAKLERHKLRGEVPQSSDLFRWIVSQPRKFASDTIVKVILKQILQGVRDLHEIGGVAHRDMKPENVAISVTRHCELVSDDDDTTTTDDAVAKEASLRVVVTEKFDVRLIDFGLAKFIARKKRDGGSSSSNSNNNERHIHGDGEASGMFHSDSGMMIPTASTLRQNVRVPPPPSAAPYAARHPHQPDNGDHFSNLTMMESMMTGSAQPSMAVEAATPTENNTAAPPVVSASYAAAPAAAAAPTTTSSGSHLSVPGASSGSGPQSSSGSGLMKTSSNLTSCSSAFPVEVTAGCCTLSYSPLEVLQHVTGEEKAFTSTSQLLPRVDIFGAGVCAYLLCQSRAPFRDTGSKALPAWAARDKKVEAIKNEMKKGLQFRDEAPASAELKAFILRIMAPDPADRPTAAEALADPFFFHGGGPIGDTVVSEYRQDGSVEVHSVRPGMERRQSSSSTASGGSSGLHRSALDMLVGGESNQSPSSMLLGAFKSPLRLARRDSNVTASSFESHGNSTDGSVESHKFVEADDALSLESGGPRTSREASANNLQGEDEDEDGQDMLLEALRVEEDDGDGDGKQE